MAPVHPHLLFAKELSVLADISHPNITESNPKTREERENKAQQSLKRGGVAGGGGGGERAGRGERQRKD